MNDLMHKLNAWFGPNAAAAKMLTLPLFVVLMLSMMVLPLPPFVLDLLFTFNIALALMVVMVSAQMVKPLDFAAFPSVLLLTTLLRLSLNVASSRVVLLEGHTGAGAAVIAPQLDADRRAHDRFLARQPAARVAHGHRRRLGAVAAAQGIGQAEEHGHRTPSGSR